MAQPDGKRVIARLQILADDSPSSRTVGMSMLMTFADYIDDRPSVRRFLCVRLVPDPNEPVVPVPLPKSGGRFQMPPSGLSCREVAPG